MRDFFNSPHYHFDGEFLNSPPLLVKSRALKMISRYGIPKWKVHEMANCRKGIWRSAIMLNSVLTVKEIANLGYVSMVDYFMKVHVN